jgi:hypothetical protein
MIIKIYFFLISRIEYSTNYKFLESKRSPTLAVVVSLCSISRIDHKIAEEMREQMNETHMYGKLLNYPG